eukprot:gene11066-18673_t
MRQLACHAVAYLKRIGPISRMQTCDAALQHGLGLRQYATESVSKIEVGQVPEAVQETLQKYIEDSDVRPRDARMLALQVSNELRQLGAVHSHSRSKELLDAAENDMNSLDPSLDGGAKARTPYRRKTSKAPNGLLGNLLSVCPLIPTPFKLQTPNRLLDNNWYLFTKF